jgi:hypothetical protein
MQRHDRRALPAIPRPGLRAQTHEALHKPAQRLHLPAGCKSIVLAKRIHLCFAAPEALTSFLALLYSDVLEIWQVQRVCFCPAIARRVFCVRRVLPDVSGGLRVGETHRQMNWLGFCYR